MRILIVEDDTTNRVLLQELAKKYGACTAVEDGEKAETAFRQALESDDPFKLVCIDIRLPGISGQELLKRIRAMEEKRDIPFQDRSKIIMTTALGDLKNVAEAFAGMCDAYLVKPIDRVKLETKLKSLGLVK